MNKKVVSVTIIVLVAFGAGYYISKQGSSGETPKPMPASSESGGASLDLSGQQLTSLPQSVLNRTDISSLDLSNNQLTGLPASIESITNLEVLNIENNRIESLPAEIAQLTNLRQILANNNRMTRLPSTLRTMTWLEFLDISGNNIPIGEVDDLKSQLTETQIKF